jgi:predicted amidohydrolase
MQHRSASAIFTRVESKDSKRECSRLVGVLATLALIFVSNSAFSAAGGSCADVNSKRARDMKIEPAKLDSLRVAAVAFPLGERATGDEFLNKIDKLVVRAKEGQAGVVVLPELITTELVNWQSQVDEITQLKNIAEKFTPVFIESVKAMAVKNQISILAGSTPRLVRGKVYNTAVLALPDGRVLLQDKIYLTPDEKEWGWTPGKTLHVFDLPWGRSVITICFDSEFPGLSQMLAPYRPEVFFVPSWTSGEAGFNRVDWATKGRAIEHYAFVIKTATIPDPKSTVPHVGNATIIGPQDGGFAVGAIEGAKNQPDMIFGNLDLLTLRARRALTGVYPVNEQHIRRSPITIQLVNEPENPNAADRQVNP